MPEDEQGDELLASILRLVDRSARNEQIMKACVEMEVVHPFLNPQPSTLNPKSETLNPKQILKACVEVEVVHPYLTSPRLT